MRTSMPLPRRAPRQAPKPPHGWLARVRAWLRRLVGRPEKPQVPEGGYRSARGFPLASRGEVMIADWLDARGYAWEYESRVGGFTPDFMLRKERLLIEYWGMKGHSRRYDARINEKKRRYRQEGWDVVGIEPRHLPRLDVKLGRKLPRPPM